MSTILDHNATAASRPRMIPIWSAGAGVLDRRHVCVASTVFEYDNFIGSAAVDPTMSGRPLGATKQAAPPRRKPR